MNTLLLQPTDVLFFRDGRPMTGSLAGHGAAWPLPTVTNAALHAALHRAGIEGAHAHRRGRSGAYSNQEQHRDRLFGSLVTAGPFPVSPSGNWYFPRPLDAGADPAAPCAVALHPIAPPSAAECSSLAKPLQYPVARSGEPDKIQAAPWWSQAAWSTYLNGTPLAGGGDHFLTDACFADAEHSIGIGIDPETSSQDGESFYSAHYLRLRDSWKLGILAKSDDKDLGEDLIQKLFPNSGVETPVIVGGQQRICTVLRHRPTVIPLPVSAGFEGRFVKWVLLSPAIYPRIEAGLSKRGTERKEHPGGWLPTWICPETGSVLLETVSEEDRRRRRQLNAAGKGYSSNPNIPAKLVAALVGKPVVVSGYALDNGLDDQSPGPKPGHFAVPAGSVFYFEAEDENAAQKLAAALNWHGSEPSPTTIRNRRSTLMGEKGFGLGVCGSWNLHDA